MDIDIDHLKDLLDEDLHKTDIADSLNVCTKTVYRCMEKHNITHARFTDISDDDLAECIREVKKTHPNDGEVLMDGHLKARTPPIKVPRSRLRAAIHYVDPDGVQARKSVTIKRRQYSVPCPHYMWHIDGNHKLIKYKMVIHGGIDGFTRMVVFMNVSDNNRAATVQSAFLHATEEFCWPIRVRTDYGGENQLIWQDMITKRGARSALVGSSVHNQPIEQLWGLINDRGTSQFKSLFQEMERSGKLNVDNETDILCLHWVFIPLIQATLSELSMCLNKRRISTEGNKTPNQLELLYKHLKEPFENPGMQADSDTSNYGNAAASLQGPLPHVSCTALGKFPVELEARLRPLGRAKTIKSAYQLYQQVVSEVGDFISGH